MCIERLEKNEKEEYEVKELRTMPLISIIIPCMDEGKTIGNCIKKAKYVLKQEGLDGEIIVADNSTDRSREIAEKLGARVITPKEKGYGNAYLEGIKYAQGKYFLFVDADDTYDLKEIPIFLKPLVEDNIDFVIGSRLMGDIKKGSMPRLHRYIGNPILTKTLNMLFRTKISDAHCGMRAITKEAYEKLNLQSGGMEFASEMIIEAARKKLKMAEVPISYYPRQTPSKLHSWGDGWRHLRFMMLYHPTPFFYIPGILLFIFGAFMTISLATKNNMEIIRFHSFILGSMMSIIGIQVFITGCYLKIYGIIHDKIDRKGFTAKLLDYHSLEIGLFTGIILFITGMILGSNVVYKWVSSGFGSLSEIRSVVISMLLIAVGIQISLFALIVSIFILDKKYENKDNN